LVYNLDSSELRGGRDSVTTSVRPIKSTGFPGDLVNIKGNNTIAKGCHPSVPEPGKRRGSL